jgi:phosphate transport system substrate-binding protein
MNRHCVARMVIACILSTLLGGAWFPCEAQQKQILRIKGSNAMANVTDRIAAEFMNVNPRATVLVTGGGTDAGFEALFEKQADLVMASRKITEKESQAAAVNRIKPVEAEVPGDAIAIITGTRNNINELSVEQLSKIFTGEFARWSEVGGADEPIIVLTLDQVTGTATFLRQQAMQDGHFSADAKVKKYYVDMMKEMAATKGLAIGYAGLPDAVRGVKQNMVKILAIKEDSQSPAVLPSQRTVKDGSYPLVRPFLFYWDGNVNREDVKKFVEFYKSRIEAYQ